MSLFSSIHIASGAMQADQIALQVVGQNIANANTPGYVREQAILTPSVSQRMGSLNLGLGVQVDAIVQKIDNFLEERLRGAVSESANSGTQESTYKQLETVLATLGDSSTGTMLTTFFNSISNILNQPESVANRNLAVLQGDALTQTVNHLADQVTTMRSDVNDQISGMAQNINRLVENVRELNVKIANTEGGDTSKSDAVGLRDQRLQALEDLSKLVGIRTEEQSSGAVNVYCGSTYLVYEGMSQQVEVVLGSDNGLTTASIHLAGNDSPLDTTSGELQGLVASRDQVLGGFLDKLDSFAQTLAFEFNKVYSAGQGLHGYQSLTSEFSVDSTSEALSAAGLKFTPLNGSFQVIVRDKNTGQSKTSDINVNLSGVGPQTTLASLAADLDAIDGVQAQADPTSGKLTITSDSTIEYAFAGDTSGVLAALGLNTFFTGSSARDLGVSQVVHDDPATFAASQDGIGADTKNAVLLAAFPDQPLSTKSGNTLSFLYDELTSSTTQESSIASSLASGARTFEDTLRGQQTATSGVNLDEEAVNMLAYQRSYQACAKFISTLNDLLEVLVNI